MGEGHKEITFKNNKGLVVTLSKDEVKTLRKIQIDRQGKDN